MSKRSEAEHQNHEDTTRQDQKDQGQERPEVVFDDLVKERDALKYRVDGLNSTLDGCNDRNIPPEEKDRLKGQLTAMTQYLDVLNARITYHRGTQQQHPG